MREHLDHLIDSRSAPAAKVGMSQEDCTTWEGDALLLPVVPEGITDEWLVDEPASLQKPGMGGCGGHADSTALASMQRK